MNAAGAVQTAPTPSGQSPRPLLSSNRLFSGSVAVLLLAPLAFGAVEPWAIFGLEACAVLLFAGWGLRQWVNRELTVLPNALYAPMLTFVALILVQLLTGATAYRQVTYSRLLLYLAYGALAFVATQTLRRASQLQPLAWAVCAYGTVVATFALFQGLAPNGKLYWIWPLEQGGFIYGPYVNHNHYAGLMEMLTPFPLVLALSRFTHGNRKYAVAGVCALMAGTLFLSGSRGGMIAFVLQMVILAVLLRRRPENWKQPIMLGGFLAIMILVLLWVGGNEFTRRLATIHSEARAELSGGTRLTIDSDTLRMWTKRPFLGWGLGTFPEVYPQFRSFYSTFFVNQAHDDYVQLLAETGVAGFAVALWFLVVTFRHARRKLQNWTETANGVLTVAALLGCAGILVHSFLDFNLQIPANAALFYVLCAIAASNPIQESPRRRRVRRSQLVAEVSPGVTPEVANS